MVNPRLRPTILSSSTAQVHLLKTYPHFVFTRCQLMGFQKPSAWADATDYHRRHAVTWKGQKPGTLASFQGLQNPCFKASFCPGAWVGCP